MHKTTRLVLSSKYQKLEGKNFALPFAPGERKKSADFKKPFGPSPQPLPI